MDCIDHTDLIDRIDGMDGRALLPRLFLRRWRTGLKKLCIVIFLQSAYAGRDDRDPRHKTPAAVAVVRREL